VIFVVWLSLLLAVLPFPSVKEDWFLTILICGALGWGLNEMRASEKKSYKVFFALLGILPIASVILGLLVEMTAGYLGSWTLFDIRNILIVATFVLGSVSLLIAFAHSIFGIERITGIPAIDC